MLVRYIHQHIQDMFHPQWYSDFPDNSEDMDMNSAFRNNLVLSNLAISRIEIYQWTSLNRTVIFKYCIKKLIFILIFLINRQLQ